jgi:hypothetical protein
MLTGGLLGMIHHFSHSRVGVNQSVDGVGRCLLYAGYVTHHTLTSVLMAVRGCQMFELWWTVRVGRELVCAVSVGRELVCGGM